MPRPRPLPEARVGAVTAVLHRAASGDLSPDDLVNALMPIVYDELREIAHAQRRRISPEAFQTTALVHEAYLRLADSPLIPERAYVFAAAARAMRNVIVDHARRRGTHKRGRGAHAVTDALDGLTDGTDLDALTTRVLDVDAALQRLEVLSPQAARVVECRFFAGLSVEETAAALDLSTATVKREWRRARAWLQHALGEPTADGSAEVPVPPSAPNADAAS